MEFALEMDEAAMNSETDGPLLSGLKDMSDSVSIDIFRLKADSFRGIGGASITVI